ncbi:peptidylprolyl isomerase [Asticcacaulis sp. AC402]|uniref:peptidylprolyl isomerase n=1 Tax=Asticcacaulis sp. AC402 TaxID=1282361 RepID=UPI0003C3D68A|nr:peptidylprolyl isomerase [Asticcacaulis sp. AC402]ESQ75422.1 hypothetical protein ABAC402_10000 [Asticcacaulis sp. AC402]
MISILREFTKSWIFKGLMVVIALSFVGAGGAYVALGSNNGTNVVTAGKQKVTAQQFKVLFERQKRAYEEQGQSVTTEALVEAGIHTRLLSEMTDRKAIVGWLQKLGVKPSNKLILAEVSKFPAFLNSVTGRFDMDTYRQQLLTNQMTDKEFEAELYDQIAISQFMSTAAAGLKAPRVFTAVDAAFTLQSRDASVFFLSPQNVANPSMPTEAEIAAFYKENQTRFVLPELRTASVITFSTAQYTQEIVVNDDDLRKVYEARRAALATPETRSFVQVRAPDMAAANKISSALKAGRSPEEAARDNKGEVITYTLKPRSAVSDSKVADAAFKMQTGEVSPPVQGTLSIAVLKMGEIKIGSAPSFESVREQLAEEVRRERASEKLNKASNDFSDALAKGEDFDAAARRLGLRVAQLEPMTAEGRTANPNANYSTYAPLVKGVYALQQVGSTSDVESLGEGEYFALKLVAIKPEGAPPLAQVQDQIVMMWMTQKMQDAINAKADEAMARLNKGESLAAVAASYKTNVRSMKGVTRQSAQQQQMPRELMGRIFLSKAGETFRAETPIPTQQGQIPAVAIGRLDGVTQGDSAQTNSMAAMTQAQVDKMVGGDLSALATTSARAAIKAHSNSGIAERALGIDPAPAAKDKTSASKS